MLQALAISFFVAILFTAFATLAALLHADWDAVTTALGMARGGGASAPLPQRYRVHPIRRVRVIRCEAPDAPRRAAA